MKVLVIDDNQTHLDSAKQTFADYELALCNNYNEARKLLVKGSYDGNAIPWDAVLCDLLMPADTNVEGKGRSFIGQEMPVGWALALLAAKRGAKYVAVVTDTNHHDHPASAMLDDLDFHLFQIDEAKILFTNHVGRVGEKGGKNWGEILKRLVTGDPVTSWREINR